MSKARIVVNGTDELGTGVVYAGPLGFPYGYKIGVTVTEDDVIDASFVVFDQHLNRLLGQGQWKWERVPFGAGDRRYFFRSAVELEPVELKPLAPSGVAALVGKDPYTTPGDIFFLVKGDRFRAERSLHGDRKEVVYGTAAMDGLAISPNYGWLTLEAEGDQAAADIKRKAYENDEKGYINVHFDHREPGAYDNYVKAEHGKAYKPQGEHWPNEGLSLKNGWKIWVLPEVAKRKHVALSEAKQTAARVAAEARLAKAKAELEQAEQALRKLG